MKISLVLSKIFSLAMLVVLLASCASAVSGMTSSLPSTVPLPSDINVIPPDSSVSKELARFSGVWSGTWDVRTETVLVVEEIMPPLARVIYANGPNLSRSVTAKWNRIDGVLEDGDLVIRLPSGATVRYGFQNGMLHGEYWWSGFTTKAILYKVK